MIGWYVHHHGHGHLRRLTAVGPHLDADVVVVSSLPRPQRLPRSRTSDVEWIELEADTPPHGEPADPTAGGHLHWVPTNVPGHRRRMVRIAEAAPRLSGMVVDVSAEVVLLSRLLGVPVTVVAQAGERTDAAHRQAYALADALLVPLPASQAADDEVWARALPHTVRHAAKTTFVGGISASAPTDGSTEAAGGSTEATGGSTTPTDDSTEAGEGRRFLLLGSRGGTSLGTSPFERLRETSRHDWSAIGLDAQSWTSDVHVALKSSALVLSNAGLGAIADIMAARSPAIFVPQVRPFDEQVANGLLLQALGFPVRDRLEIGEAFDAEVDAVSRCDFPWEAWQTEGAPGRAAEVIHRVCASAGGLTHVV